MADQENGDLANNYDNNGGGGDNAENKESQEDR